MTTSPSSLRGPRIGSPDFIDFLHWLAAEGATTDEVIYVVEKPHKFADRYAEYLADGGTDRD